MTESEWLSSSDIDRMLKFLHGRTNDRKFRMFACACCRRVWHLLDERCRRLVEMAEQYLDGLISLEEMASASAAAFSGPCFALGRPGAAIDAVAETLWCNDDHGGSYHAALCAYSVFYALGEPETERISQCHLLREIIGNPFHPDVNNLDSPPG
jgi:hypothetical protein